MASELEGALIAGLADGEHVNEPRLICPQSNIDRDARFLEQMLDAGDRRRLLRIWTNSRCLVASRTQGHHPGFASAAAALRAEGWPVVMRSSGGSAVVHRPGILNLSLFMRAESCIDIAEIYTGLTSLLGRAVQGLGIACDHGPVEGAYCDGRYNLRCRGRKVAGLAAALRRKAGRTAYVVHASITVAGKLDEDLDAITRFESLLGFRSTYRRSAHTTLLTEHLTSVTRQEPAPCKALA